MDNSTDTAPAPVRRELDVTDIFATTNVGGAEFTARPIAAQECLRTTPRGRR